MKGAGNHARSYVLCLVQVGDVLVPQLHPPFQSCLRDGLLGQGQHSRHHVDAGDVQRGKSVGKAGPQSANTGADIEHARAWSRKPVAQLGIARQNELREHGAGHPARLALGAQGLVALVGPADVATGEQSNGLEQRSGSHAFELCRRERGLSERVNRQPGRFQDLSGRRSQRPALTAHRQREGCQTPGSAFPFAHGFCDRYRGRHHGRHRSSFIVTP